MRQLLLAATAVLVLGCASEPTVEPKVAAGYVPTHQPETEDHEASRKYGCKIVNEDGKVLYCRSQTRIASRIRKEATCLTEEELPMAREANERNIENIKKGTPPPQWT